MKFSKELNPTVSDALPPANQPVPMRPKTVAVPDDSNSLADLSRVAQRLGVSKRYVQRLVRRKVIPAIRLGRRCTRFDLDSVLTAVKQIGITKD
jgi:excisionase family DNA binding protein